MKRGFTLLEMMVVLAISLTLMVIVVPVFQVTTRTISHVDRKMRTYEAARNVLDIIEGEITLAVVNERGDGFHVKSLDYNDTDKFHPVKQGREPAPAPATYPSWSDVNNIAYHGNRRFADSINYAKMQGGGFRGAFNLILPGAQAFPLTYPELFMTTPEAWKCTIRSTLQYGQWYNVWQDLSAAYKRSGQLADVAQIRVEMMGNVMSGQFRNGGGPWDEIWETFAPGCELKATGDLWGNTNAPPGATPAWSEDPNAENYGPPSGDLYYAYQRAFGTITVMDLDVAYWNDRDRMFKDVPKDSLLSFAPAPKAIRITATVCDKEKRNIVTVSRIIQLSFGQGICDDEIDGPRPNGDKPQLTLSAMESALRLDVDPAPHNRTKNLKKLQPSLYK